jgi:hypothetical protein
MKWTTIFITLFVLIACKNSSDITKVDKPKKFKSTKSDNNELEKGKSNEQSNCNFENFISDKTTPKLAKDIYLDKDWNLSNDMEALALLDSLNAKDISVRPFYFKVVTKTYKKSDGYFSEGLGIKGYNYVLKNTQEFASHFDNKECFTNNDLETWADIMLLEIHIEQENVETTKEEHLVYQYCRKLKNQSENFTASQKQTINNFIGILEKKWVEFLKNN